MDAAATRYPGTLPASSQDVLHPGAEVFNFVTHLAGALAGLVGATWLVLNAETVTTRAALGVYGVTLVLLFCASSLHHALAHTVSNRQLCRRLDHVSIYLLIAGSYTPPCVLILPAWPGLAVLVAVWAFAAVGIALKLLRPFTSRWVTISLYLAMGWMAIFAVGPLVAALEPEGLALLAGGGIVYSVGAIVYALKRPDPWPRVMGFHGLWHIFVLVAAGMHFAFMARHVAPA